MAYILIVDDDEMVAEMASDVLLGAGYACGWVTSAKDALGLLRWRRPDLVLLDQDMPEMTGGQLLREMRKSVELYDLPVIMFTAITGAVDEEQARFNGAQDYIRKPFDPAFLKWKVNQALKSKAERPQHRDLRDILAVSSGRNGSDTTGQMKRFC